MSKEPLSEKVSEIKRVRGRPKSVCRMVYESCPIFTEGCDRTRISWQYAATLSGAVADSDEETQRVIWGRTLAEFHRDLGGEFPKGWKTLAEEAGRFMDTAPEDDHEELKQVVLDRVKELRSQGRSFGDIAAFFRRLRIGEKKGSQSALLKHLCRAFDNYMRMFPSTSHEDQLAAIDMLRSAVEHLSAAV